VLQIWDGVGLAEDGDQGIWPEMRSRGAGRRWGSRRYRRTGYDGGSGGVAVELAGEMGEQGSWPESGEQ
jgi:hypothetical protein